MTKENIYDTLCRVLTDYENDEITGLDFYTEIVDLSNRLAEELY